MLDFVIDFAYSPFALNQGQKQVFALTVELFAEQESRVYSVSEITRAIKTTLEDSLPTVWIEGEISNFIHHSSGHMYFSLKDADAQINCVMWRSRIDTLRFVPLDGMKILALGNIRVYEKRGSYQLDCIRLVAAGRGELQLAFERLKERLYSEGLFDAEHKKPIPEFPQQVGVITSPTGAAIRDILQVMRRRFPGIGIILRPALVQGQDAAVDLAKAIAEFNEFGLVDVIILTRGGGSLEDLQPFNEEMVARAIFSSAIPIVSAVGHEIDFTISDFVADLRAPTPSAAAELVVPDSREWRVRLQQVQRHLVQQMENRCRMAGEQIRRIRSSYAFRQPEERLHQLQQQIDDLAAQLSRAMQLRFERAEQRLQSIHQRLVDQQPQTILRRGYCLVWNDEKQKFTLAARDLRQNDALRLYFGDGGARAVVTQTGLPAWQAGDGREPGGSNEKTDL